VGVIRLASPVATSVGHLALFGGGDGVGLTAKVDIFNSTNGAWTTAILSVTRSSLAATSVGELALFGGGEDNAGSPLATVDIFNSTSEAWTTAMLSEVRSQLAATSVGELALFGGGAK